MFRQPNALKEINKIQEAIYKEEKKMSSKERVSKVRLEAGALRNKYGLTKKQVAQKCRNDNCFINHSVSFSWGIHSPREVTNDVE